MILSEISVEVFAFTALRFWRMSEVQMSCSECRVLCSKSYSFTWFLWLRCDLILKQTGFGASPWVCHSGEIKTTTVGVSRQRWEPFILCKCQERDHCGPQRKSFQHSSFSPEDSSESRILSLRPKLPHFLSHVSPLTQGFQPGGLLPFGTEYS